MSDVNGANLFSCIFIDIGNIIKIGISRLKNALSLSVGLRNDILGIGLLNGLSGGEGLSFGNGVALVDLIKALFDLGDDRFGFSGS